jgi:hypothetical protein
MTRRKMSRRKKIRAEFKALTEEEFDTSVGAELGIPRPRNGTATQMIRWLADIGIRSIEDRYPKRRLGRPKGTTKSLPLRDPSKEPDAMKMRRRRARQKLKKLSAALDQQGRKLNAALDQRIRELENAIEAMTLLFPEIAQESAAAFLIQGCEPT